MASSLIKVHIAFALAAVLVAVEPACAQTDRETVRLDGRMLFRVGPYEDQSATERASHIEQRIAMLLENPRAIGPARVEETRSADELLITVSGVPLVRVSRQDAQDNLTPLEDLATQWARVLTVRLEQSAARRTSAWGRFRSEVQGSVEGALARLLESAITVIPRLTAAALMIALFWLLAITVRWLMRLLFRRVIDDLTVENLLKQIVFYSVWVLGVVLAIDALGFDPQATATGLGLTGLALGFALKDIISNFISGILILTLRPFRLGDQIIVGETEGSVERIQLRATQIRTYDGRAVLVPNSELFTSRVTNNTASPVRRGSVQLFFGYDAPLEKILPVAQQATAGAEGVLETPAVTVRVAEFSPADVVVEVQFWSDSRRTDYQSANSNVRREVLQALRQAGVALPEPGLRHLIPREIDQWRRIAGDGPSSASVASMDGRDAGPGS